MPDRQASALVFRSSNMQEQEPLRFSSKSKEGQVISNFEPLPVKVDDLDAPQSGVLIQYPTGEHAFHGSKFMTAAQVAREDGDMQRATKLGEYAEKFRTSEHFETPADAKRAGGKRRMSLNQKELERWSVYAHEVQKTICVYKALHYDVVRECLQNSKGRLLLHQDNRARAGTPWGGRLVGTGTSAVVIGDNGLGKIWMEVRDQLMSEGTILSRKETGRKRKSDADGQQPAAKMLNIGSDLVATIQSRLEKLRSEMRDPTTPLENLLENNKFEKTCRMLQKLCAKEFKGTERMTNETLLMNLFSAVTAEEHGQWSAVCTNPIGADPLPTNFKQIVAAFEGMLGIDDATFDNMQFELPEF